MSNSGPYPFHNEVFGTREIPPEELALLGQYEDMFVPIKPGVASITEVADHPPLFEVPEGAMPVLMQVGTGPVTVIGWAATGADVPPLLHEVADKLAGIQEERAESASDS